MTETSRKGTGSEARAQRCKADHNQCMKTMQALEEWGNTHLKFPDNLTPLYDKQKTPVLSGPGNLTDAMVKSPGDTIKWAEAMKLHSKLELALKGNLKTLFTLIWGQYSSPMQTKIKQHKDYDESPGNADCEWLLQQVKAVMYKFKGKKDVFFLR